MSTSINHNPHHGRPQPQMGYLALPHAQHYIVSDGEKKGLGNPNTIHMRTSPAFHDVTSRSYMQNSTHINSEQI